MILYQLLLFTDTVIADCNKHVQQCCCCYLISTNVEGSLYFAILDHCLSYLMCIYNGMQVLQAQVICWTSHVNWHCGTFGKWLKLPWKMGSVIVVWQYVSNIAFFVWNLERKPYNFPLNLDFKKNEIEKFRKFDKWAIRGVIKKFVDWCSEINTL